MEGSEKIDLAFEAHGLIDNIEFSGVVSADKEVDSSLNNDHLPELHESTEPQLNQRNGRYNLRKSLAWDSAFFTSAGVLDPEELSSMMTGADKGEKHFLPGIQEDVSLSTESISTFQSDNLTLETLEDDLFVDIRASIQRSSKKTSNLTKSISEAATLEVDSAAISSLKKEDFASQNKNPRPGSKKTSGLQTVRLSKCQPKQNSGKVGSGKAIKQDSGHSQITSIAKTGETNLFPKPPKTISSFIPTSTTTKRDSVGAGRLKSESGSLKLGIASSKGTQPSKASVVSGARRVLPKPAVSSKASLLGSSTTSRVQATRSSASSDSASSMSSGTPAKPTALAPRRNAGKSGNVGTGLSGSIPKTPSRALPKNKPAPSKLSAYLMSAKISSSVSPASSISEWSSASSSSSSMFNQRSSNSRTSLDTSSCRSVDGDVILLDPSNESADQTADVHGNQEVSLTSNILRKSSTQTGTGQALTKPSGLRMPSPKIGFFDGAKSTARTPNGHQQSQSGLHAVFPKNGAATCTPIRSSNSKLKSAKAPIARTSTSFGSTKDSSPKVTSPTSFQEKSHALVNASSVKMDVKDSFPTGESCQKAEEVQAEGVKQVVGEGIGVIVKENVGDLNMHESMGTGDIKTASVEEIAASGSEHTDRIGDLLINKNHVKKNSDPICEDTDKENLHVKYPVGEMTGDNKDAYHIVHESINEILSNISESESAACRAPFALKNVFCSHEGIDMLKELATQGTQLMKIN
ncbi:hypothetical protein Salat_1004700 [Sesamum alatum]|uniref:Uncharacterized protein n=1 Tax=Sesamum alatum TaxID=300844 RepID=A0AAE2CS07_9LAMI|nr:hypothetical protein Salat_1004700 [Sesamum alatum]